jgi:hypothetical protein
MKSIKTLFFAFAMVNLIFAAENLGSKFPT